MFELLNFLKILKTDLLGKESYGGFVITFVITYSQFEKRNIHQKITRYANSLFNIFFSGNENVGVKWCTKIN